jgi:hypothetical protein
MQRRFNLKNLMTQIRPELERAICWPYSGCRYFITWCNWWTCNWWTVIDCPAFTLRCPAFTIDPCEPFSQYIEDPRDIVVNPEVINTLRAQLTRALEEIDLHEKMAQEQYSPQSMDEIDQLEGELKSALEELQARRDQLSGRGGG